MSNPWFVIFSLYFLYVSTTAAPGNFTKAYSDASRLCYQESTTGSPPENYDPSKPTKDILSQTCFYQQMNYLNSDNSLNLEVMKTVIRGLDAEGFQPSDQMTLNMALKLVDTCGSQKGDTPIQTVQLLLQCFADHKGFHTLFI